MTLQISSRRVGVDIRGRSDLDPRQTVLRFSLYVCSHDVRFEGLFVDDFFDLFSGDILAETRRQGHVVLLLLGTRAVPAAVRLEVRQDVPTVGVDQLGPRLPQRMNDVVHETNLTQHSRIHVYAV